MQLKHPFPLRVRLLYLYHSWECWECGSNGNGRGGIELHHIWGRISPSALNSAPVCGRCHSHMGHSLSEHLRLFRKTLTFLLKEHYKLIPEDHEFLELVKNDLVGFKL